MLQSKQYRPYTSHSAISTRHKRPMRQEPSRVTIPIFSFFSTGKIKLFDGASKATSHAQPKQTKPTRRRVRTAFQASAAITARQRRSASKPCCTTRMQRGKSCCAKVAIAQRSTKQRPLLGKAQYEETAENEGATARGAEQRRAVKLSMAHNYSANHKRKNK